MLICRPRISPVSHFRSKYSLNKVTIDSKLNQVARVFWEMGEIGIITILHEPKYWQRFAPKCQFWSKMSDFQASLIDQLIEAWQSINCLEFTIKQTIN